MAKFKYVGDPRNKFDGPETTEQFGYKWVKGEVTEVREETDEEKALVEKISRHSHFVNMADSKKTADASAQMDALEKGKQARAKANEDAAKEAEAEAERKRQADIKAAADANTTAHPVRVK